MRDFARPGRFGAQALIVVRLLRRGKGKMVNREAARQHNATTSQDVEYAASQLRHAAVDTFRLGSPPAL